MFLAAAALVVMWLYGSEMPLYVFIPVYIAQLLLAVIVAVMVHNHQHLSMWTSKFMNYITDYWLTLFYGFPIFAWIPTHMTNHHVNVNTEEDYTRTYKYSDKNNLLTLITYPSISGVSQQKPVKDFFFATYKRNKKRFFTQFLQVFFLAVFVVTMVILDWQKAILYVIIPQQVSLFSVLIFNYVQHVHADESTKFNNSRNFVGGTLNLLLLNNSYNMANHL
jgi:fatty acid desaturase